MALKNGERVTIMNKKTGEVVEATRKIVGGRLGYVFPVAVNGKTLDLLHTAINWKEV